MSYALANGDTIIKGLDSRDVVKCIKLNDKENVPVVLSGWRW